MGAVVGAVMCMDEVICERGLPDETTTRTTKKIVSSGTSRVVIERIPAPSEEEMRPYLGYVPKVLHLVTPNGQLSCQGVYSLVESMKPNGQPLWWKAATAQGGDRWLFSSTAGRWSIGGRKAQARSFLCTTAHIFCSVPHLGVLPHLFERSWWRSTGDCKHADCQQFVEDSDISVATTMSEWGATMENDDLALTDGDPSDEIHVVSHDGRMQDVDHALRDETDFPAISAAGPAPNLTPASSRAASPAGSRSMSPRQRVLSRKGKRSSPLSPMASPTPTRSLRNSPTKSASPAIHNIPEEERIREFV